MGKSQRPPPPPPFKDMELGTAPSKAKASSAAGGGPRPSSRHYQYVPNTAWTPWLIPTFVAANVVAFGVSMYINDCPSNAEDPLENCLCYPALGRFSFQPFSENPLLGPSLPTLDRMGALYWKKIVAQGEGWRLISCIWLHAGVIHLLANMFSLLFVGVRLEQEFGFVRIGILYILSGFGGSLLSSIALGKSISVGASGALFGFLGAMLSELITNWTIYANKCAALSTLLFVICLNLAVGFVPHVDNSAHIGGFISGFLLGFILLLRPQYGWINHKHIPPGYDMDLLKPKHKTYQYLLLIFALILLIAGSGQAISGVLEMFSVPIPCWVIQGAVIFAGHWDSIIILWYITGSVMLYSRNPKDD